VFSVFSSTPIRQSTPPNLLWCNFGKSAPFPDFYHDKIVLLQCLHGFVSRMTVDVRNLKRLPDVRGLDDWCFVTHSEPLNMCPAQSFGKTCHREWLALKTDCAFSADAHFCWLQPCLQSQSPVLHIQLIKTLRSSLLLVSTNPVFDLHRR
jgi:hypothetical protein